MPSLKPAFAERTARSPPRSSSSIRDGAAALVMMRESTASTWAW
ncbi:hypothetical protein ACU4GD_23390 [Cupriavidus basilensis]